MTTNIKSVRQRREAIHKVRPGCDTSATGESLRPRFEGVSQGFQRFLMWGIGHGTPEGSSSSFIITKVKDDGMFPSSPVSERIGRAVIAIDLLAIGAIESRFFARSIARRAFGPFFC